MSTFLLVVIILLAIVVLPNLWRLIYFAYLLIADYVLYRKIIRSLANAPRIIERKIAEDKEARG